MWYSWWIYVIDYIWIYEVLLEINEKYMLLDFVRKKSLCIKSYTLLVFGEDDIDSIDRLFIKFT